MSKIENKLQHEFNSKGYDVDCDNRSYYTKSINTVLSNPIISFELVKKGYLKKQKNGFKYNTTIRVNGRGKVFRLKSFDSETLLTAFAQVLDSENIKHELKTDACSTVCSKCNGKGKIEAFRHISKGVCFDCLGVGYKFI